jgi:hypothetical protein
MKIARPLVASFTQFGEHSMTATVSELNPKSRSRSDRERFGDILVVQRAAYLRDEAPSLTKRPQ